MNKQKYITSTFTLLFLRYFSDELLFLIIIQNKQTISEGHFIGHVGMKASKHKGLDQLTAKPHLNLNVFTSTPILTLLHTLSPEALFKIPTPCVFN